MSAATSVVKYPSDNSRAVRAARHNWQVCKRKALIAVDAAENDDMDVATRKLIEELDDFDPWFTMTDAHRVGLYNPQNRHIVPDFRI